MWWFLLQPSVIDLFLADSINQQYLNFLCNIPWGYDANKPCWGLLIDVPLPFFSPFSPKKWAPHISTTIEVSSLRSSPTWIHLFTLMLNSRSFLGIGYLSCLPSVIFFISLVQLATNVQVIMHPKSMTLQLQGSDTQSVILLSIIWS